MITVIYINLHLAAWSLTCPQDHFPLEIYGQFLLCMANNCLLFLNLAVGSFHVQHKCLPLPVTVEKLPLTDTCEIWLSKTML